MTHPDLPSAPWLQPGLEALRNLRRSPRTALLAGVICWGGQVWVLAALSIHLSLAHPELPMQTQVYQVALWRAAAALPLEAIRPRYRAAPTALLPPEDSRALTQDIPPDQYVSTWSSLLLARGNASDDFQTRVIWASQGLFTLFGLWLEEGRSWSSAEPLPAEVVVNPAMCRLLTHHMTCIGESLVLRGQSFRVVGVLHPNERRHILYDLNRWESIQAVAFIPDAWGYALKASPELSYPLWNALGSGPRPANTPTRATVSLWVHLPSAAERSVFEARLSRYAQQRSAAEKSPVLPVLRDPARWRDELLFVPVQARLYMGLAPLVWAGCMLGFMQILLVRFEARSGELGLRRALGASQRMLCQQLQLECAWLGALAGLLTPPAAQLVVWSTTAILPTLRSELWIEPSLVGLTLLLSPILGWLAGRYPGRVLTHPPIALQLKAR